SPKPQHHNPNITITRLTHAIVGLACSTPFRYEQPLRCCLSMNEALQALATSSHGIFLTLLLEAPSFNAAQTENYWLPHTQTYEFSWNSGCVNHQKTKGELST